ncbi:MAG: hypothetical protein KGZ65_04335 [Sphingomonadales bacterium]|nr:hypothetical protein [Sphingomonadaceae bacterium]MBS3930442.1 hypothetical protein [Sphingomonadales bacterium]
MVETNNLLLGLGKLYLKREGDTDGKYRMVGALKDKVEFTYKQEIVKQKVGELMGAPRADRINEEAMLKAQICDFKIEQLIPLLGLTVSTTALTVTNSIRRVEEHITGISTTDTQTLSQTAKSKTSVHITSLDRATDYVQGTDFTMPTARGIKPVTSAFRNLTVLAHYTSRRTTKRVRIGDHKTLPVMSLMFTHKMKNGKMISLIIPRCHIEGDITIPWGEKEYTAYDISFSALADTTQPEGRRLFHIVKES